MRQVSGTGSDDDGTDLRKRENVARQRSGDDDTMLPGPILMQRSLPARLVFHVGEDIMATVWARERAGRGTAMMMMVVMAAPRGGRRDGSVSSGSRSAARLTRHMHMMIATPRSSRWGQGVKRDGGPTGNWLVLMPMMAMMMVLIKTLASVISDDGRRRRGAGGLMMRLVAPLVDVRGDGLLAAQAPA